MNTRRDLLVAGLTATLTLAAAGQSPTFQGLGQMPGSTFAGGTYSSGISGDGSTIMGYGWVCPGGQPKCNSTGTVQAYRWTVAGGYQILGSPSNSSFFGSGAISYDGAAITGEHPIGNANRFEAFRWTAAQGLKQLPLNIASAITADGKMVAGGDNWWMTSGQSGIFGPFPGEQDQTEAFGLAGTAEAPVAVGAAIKGSGAQGATYHAFRWTPAGGLQDLGVGDGTQSYATAISADGQVVVGETLDAFGLNRAFRWTASAGMQDMGTLGGPESAALGVSADGTVVVGTSLTNSSTGSSVCFIWTAKTGMQNLLAVLQAAGVHTADDWVTLAVLDGVSADGTVMVGFGQSPRTNEFPFGNNEPFRVVLPAL
jgi:probable HAF family extracellular repeat protein